LIVLALWLKAGITSSCCYTSSIPCVTVEERCFFHHLVTPLPDDVSLPRIPEAVLQRRWSNKGTSVVRQVRVKWSSWPHELATWEDLEALQSRFPDAPAWGQAATQEGGCWHRTYWSTSGGRPTSQEAQPEVRRLGMGEYG
jgi:hypothetical protein